MYILHLADLHFSKTKEKNEIERRKKILEQINKAVKEAVPKEEKVIIVACGDFINQGEIEAYSEVEEFLKELIEKISSEQYSTKIMLVPGNHDLKETDLSAYHLFAQKITGIYIENTDCNVIQVDNHEEKIDMVLINSVDSASRGNGRIDYDKLEEKLNSLEYDTPKIFVLHHTLISMDDTDRSSIRNVPRFIKLIDDHNVKLMLHGHSHGVDAMPFGHKQCAIAGVGALLSRNNADVNSQFNLIHFEHGEVCKIDNYSYHSDSDKLSCNKLGILTKKIDAIYTNDSFSAMYNELISDLKVKKRLYNVSLRGEYDYNSFKADIEKNIDVYTDFNISYRDLAAEWQKAECPTILYFSHGQYCYNKEKQKEGIEYIIEALKEKKTSSRAILSTINISNIMEAGDLFLPSLIAVQFGFDVEKPDTLFATMSLRALEASRFLKINVCEILYMASKIKQEISFTHINITINAFRVQIVENFSCFIKAEIDMMATDEQKALTLHEWVCNHNYAELIRLFEEKQNNMDTVIVTDGVQKILTSMKWVNSDANNKYDRYNDELLDCMSKLLKVLAEYKCAREHDSITETLKKNQELVAEAFEKCIMLLKQDENGEKNDLRRNDS